jgi:hypothetical protein
MQYAPRLLELSWGGNTHAVEDRPFDATSLVKLRAPSDLFRCSFVCHEVAEEMHPLHAEECELVGKDEVELDDYIDDLGSFMGCYCQVDYSWIYVWKQEKLQNMAFIESWQSLILQQQIMVERHQGWRYRRSLRL